MNAYAFSFIIRIKIIFEKLAFFFLAKKYYPTCGK
jgi:hypothetical protein